MPEVLVTDTRGPWTRGGSGASAAAVPIWSAMRRESSAIAARSRSSAADMPFSPVT